MKKILCFVACVLSSNVWANPEKTEDFSKIDQEFLNQLQAEKNKKSQVVTKLPKQSLAQTQKNKQLVLRSIEKPVFNRPKPLQIVAVEEYRFTPAPSIIIYQ